MKTLSSPFLPVTASVGQVMRDVLIALAPGVVVYALLFGPGVLINIVLAVLTCELIEAAVLKLRGRALKPFLLDSSALVTGVLLALAVPPTAPWWIIVVGCGFAMLLGKHVYGGLGYNPFNPAMVGFVVLLISFPVQMTAWPSMHPLWDTTDAVSGATALDHVKTQLSLERTLSEIRGDTPLGLFAGRGWEWIALAYLLGGGYMLWRRTIRWQIPVGLLLGMTVIAGAFWAYDGDRYASPLFHWFSGATMLGAFFIATDPVSAATTPRGRFVFGFGIGMLTYVIRTWGGYPDGIAFAVLLFNICAPTLDRYLQPRIYGQRRDKPQA
ncbi:RnfABCDGE type electron transport complex subunit D [Sinimarinibacterium sp. CAU 1509]|uniref:RnfABCDGE type electron transport complex subunit D n=1 Tax=Sinimarinibacterium sp. CAU 1509 TaxID=2562283 RepID=UPI0010AC6B3C|nr:RnfABCDGE type electron transport complex subunit D [Sinimarinibacterium sp. CAU 1509]TJY62900.1 RnfABCDGE type electron transport complex subunit D [Sinimarinibacterium sp. CAU 1509]